MDIFDKKEQHYKNAVIKVIGVGGGGSNAVAHMFAKNIEGVECIASNTDAKALHSLEVDTILPLGTDLTKGLGAGANPEIGRDAALENRDKIVEVLTGTDMLFITAGMGGGTGTGASPIIAEIAKELGVLTVAVVTKPFHFEGQVRQKTATNGIDALAQHVDSYIVISNDRLLPVLGDTTLVEAFSEVNNVLWDSVCGISDLIIRPGLIGLDFADVCTVVRNMGTTMIGTGMVEAGSKAATQAAEAALSSPLLENIDLQNAQGILVNISGGKELSLKEFTEVGTTVRSIAAKDATIVIGVSINENIQNHLKVTVVATGLDNNNTKNSIIQNTQMNKTQHDLEKTQYSDSTTNQHKSETPNLTHSKTTSDNDDNYNYLDIPSFIRRNNI